MDFIIAWVDGNDPAWQKDMRKYKNDAFGDTHTARFRNWENLHYWFRGIEKFAPWVDKIHFVTWGHLPKWLNREHPKLNVIQHQDYIPAHYLPTFNSRTIDLNFHRIEDLSEEYVYFNDDMFLISPLRKESFFWKKKPCDMGVSAMISSVNDFQRTILKNAITINKHFQRKKMIRENLSNWFNLKYGLTANLKNLFFYFIQGDTQSGFKNFHLPQASRKETLKRLWKEEPAVMDQACRNAFRNYSTVNQYVQRYWQLASNEFHPVNLNERGKTWHLREERVEKAAEFIRNQEKPMVCINDHKEMLATFTVAKAKINSAFDAILPDKSTFEN